MDATTYVVPGLPEPEPAGEPPGLSKLSDLLRLCVRHDGRPLAVIARAAGLSPSDLSRFMRGEQGMHLDSADRIAAVLGFRWTPRD